MVRRNAWWVFEEWKYICIVYVVVQMQFHLWQNINKLLWVESKCHINYIRYYENSIR